MKKVLILGSIILAVCGYIFMDDLNPKGALLSKLEKFNQMDNLYYQAEYTYKFMEIQDETLILKQFKRGKNYNAKLINPLSRMESIIEVNGNSVKLLERGGYLVVDGNIDESKRDKSFFWYDKISPKQIKKDSIKKVKTPANLSNLKCKMFSAKLAKTNNNIDICINNQNIPVYMNYHDEKNFLPLLFDINPITSVTKNNSDIIVKITDIKTNPTYDSSFDLKPAPYATTMTVSQMKRQIAEEKARYEELNKSMSDLKNVMKEINEFDKQIRNSNKDVSKFLDNKNEQNNF